MDISLNIKNVNSVELKGNSAELQFDCGSTLTISVNSTKFKDAMQFLINNGFKRVDNFLIKWNCFYESNGSVFYFSRTSSVLAKNAINFSDFYKIGQYYIRKNTLKKIIITKTSCVIYYDGMIETKFDLSDNCLICNYIEEMKVILKDLKFAYKNIRCELMILCFVTELEKELKLLKKN